jgi:actin-related protein
MGGDLYPSLINPTIIGKSKKSSLYLGMGEKESCYFGEDALKNKNFLNFEYPIQNGKVDLNNMELLLANSFETLRLFPQEHNHFFTDSPNIPNFQREKIAQLLFETFRTPSIFICLQQILSLYASGKVNGLVLDSGHQTTSIVPIIEGIALRENITTSNVAGEEISNQLKIQLEKKGNSYLDFENYLDELKEESSYIKCDNVEDENIVFQLPDGKLLKIGKKKN